MAYTKKEYVISDAVSRAQQALKNQQEKKPGSYESRWQAQREDALNALLNREKFQYDLSTDALYRQYKDQYVNRGRMAMMDTMGQAAALTGGYGNSYAQTAGQQTYQGYLQGLNEAVPQLYAMALEKYRMEGDALQENYNALQAQEELDYGRYQDALDAYYRELEHLTQSYESERDFDYGQYKDREELAYTQHRDDIADRQWQEKLAQQEKQNQLSYEKWLREFEYQKAQDQLAYEQWLQEFQENQRRYDQEWAAASAVSSGRGSGGGSGGKQEQTISETEQSARSFVEDMLNNATSSRFDPERVINGTNKLTQEQKQIAKTYLSQLLKEGYMK